MQEIAPRDTNTLTVPWGAVVAETVLHIRGGILHLILHLEIVVDYSVYVIANVYQQGGSIETRFDIHCAFLFTRLYKISNFDSLYKSYW